MTTMPTASKRKGSAALFGRRASRMRLSLLLLAGLSLGLGATACKKKVTSAQCDELLDRFAQLVVRERLKDAPPEQVKAEQAREREEATSDDNFKNCTSELSTEDYACAMAATTSDGLMKCLE